LSSLMERASKGTLSAAISYSMQPSAQLSLVKL
jgi:hypothetical protein